ncbi:ATP-dependent DNA/RNA helicase DHX36-like isoform X2 [Bacillus rossius redtenbacheri]
MCSELIRDVELDEWLMKEVLKKKESERYQKMLTLRKKLPAFKNKNEILELIRKNQIILISGETGCGKTTQVAQFILDDYISRGQGSLCHVVCTQPRRISAISVAERVAQERDESCGSVSVGYQIRLEARLPRSKGSILYCTTGMLLQFMRSDPGLRTISHLILDEIHERDVISDFVITIMKDVLPKRPDLKLILMSATLNAEHFSKYYNNCPSINIAGFTFPVHEYYLEDVLEMTNFRSFKAVADQEPQGWRKHLHHFKAKIKGMEDYKDFIEPYVRHLKTQGKYSDHVLTSLRNPDSEQINVDLIEALIHHICRNKDDGAILVFLPGWTDIAKLNSLLTECRRYSPDRYIIIPLHSLMPTTTQKSVFDKPPPGVRKIVLATNIAETSITIDDVVFVVDCGKIKMKNFDKENNISTLNAEWVSLANARQRRGRAGRVQPGICYHLYSKAREMILADYPLPEMLRTRLEEVILQLKILQLGRAKPFLERVMDPPDSGVIDLSLKLLHTLNALDEDENLTPLGYHLANLPLDPQIGKMVLMGAIFSCIDPVFSIAAGLSFKDPFVVPLGSEARVNAVKFKLSKGIVSDHLVVAEALRQWEIADRRGHGPSFCWDHFLSSSTMVMLRNMKQQFAKYMHDMNFLTSDNVKDPNGNLNSDNIGLVKAIICSGLYPNVAIIRQVKRIRRTGKMRVVLCTPEDGKVQLHPKSITEKMEEFDSPFLLYHMKLKSTAIFLHDASVVNPLPLLFFGESLRSQMEDGAEVIAVSDAIRFRCPESTATLVKDVRDRLNGLLEHKVTHPGVVDWNVHCDEGKLLRAIIYLITYEDKQMRLKAEDGDDEFLD